MNHWLSSISYERFLADVDYAFAVDGYRDTEFNRALRVEQGDLFVYYIKQLAVFGALGEARGRCYLDWVRLWPDGSYPVRFERRPLLVLPRAQMVPAGPLVPHLSLALGWRRENPSLEQSLRFDLQGITQTDYQLIEREMRRMGESYAD
ncbi:MAG: hypothetical protein QGH66_07695 [Dehalococcoidia bacterium]|jgi:hypothetical protein|nr:hypothetical protein [Dehalococcoidia bacterium]MDP7470666.1 hypothetical protein [Dehalococcoidia bacterium]